MGEPAQSPIVGAQPTATAQFDTHTPVALHVWHSPHCDAQQTPREQMPLPHWAPVVHGRPNGCRQVPLALHTSGEAHAPRSSETKHTSERFVGAAEPARHAPGRRHATLPHTMVSLIDAAAPAQ
jgi:hypothetical protein